MSWLKHRHTLPLFSTAAGHMESSVTLDCVMELEGEFQEQIEQVWICKSGQRHGLREGVPSVLGWSPYTWEGSLLAMADPGHTTETAGSGTVVSGCCGSGLQPGPGPARSTPVLLWSDSSALQFSPCHSNSRLLGNTSRPGDGRPIFGHLLVGCSPRLCRTGVFYV